MTAALDLTADERATLERIEAAPAADEDTVERVARAIMDADYMQATGGLMQWADLAKHEQDDFRALARAAIAALKPAPGTGSSGQAVQRVLALADELAAPEEPQSHYHDGLIKGRRDAAARIRAAVAGPQRDHGGEGA